MTNEQIKALEKLQAELVDDWNQACINAEENGDEYPYPIFLTVDEYIELSRGDMNVH